MREENRFNGNCHSRDYKVVVRNRQISGTERVSSVEDLELFIQELTEKLSEQFKDKSNKKAVWAMLRELMDEDTFLELLRRVFWLQMYGVNWEEEFEIVAGRKFSDSERMLIRRAFMLVWINSGNLSQETGGKREYSVAAKIVRRFFLYPDRSNPRLRDVIRNISVRDLYHEETSRCGIDRRIL